MLRIAIVDDKRFNRVNLKAELESSGKVQVLFTAENGVDFLEQMKETLASNIPEIVLMDIDMPEKNGIDTVRMAKQIYPSIEFLMLTVFDDDDKIFEAIQAGASGYLLKDESPKTILNYLQQVKEFRSVPMSPAVARKTLKLLSNAPVVKIIETVVESNLSPRETEVLKGLVEGLDYKEIAEKLDSSPNTVRNQISSVYQKLHVTCKVDAVKIALKNKIV
ncbi:MAG: response regulator [Flavobacteriia bacterium]|jgi:DNA-binding NarL/FixJ family response regulator